jgi:LacI family transcriptional regulator, kdg operon repressor
VQQALSHLVGNGYRELLYVTEPVAGVSSRVERAAAFRMSVASLGQGVAGQVAEIGDDDDEVTAALRALQSRAGRRPCAVLASNAVVTLRVARAVAQLGWRFGADLGFVGFDETEWAPLVGAGLTTIAQPTDDIGRVAANCLFDRLQGRGLPTRQILLRGQLVARASSQRGSAAS